MTICYVNRRRVRKIVALVAATTLLGNNFAYALCADGTVFPAGGYVIGQPPVQNPANFSVGVFTGTAGSIFVPDNSTFENNDPAQPLTGGGHNWVFDQGSTLCKETDTGPAGQPATNWLIPPNTPAKCVELPIIKGGRVTNIGDIPLQGMVITPTCNPALLSAPLAPNPANTYFNQLGCSISHGVATDAHVATSYLFVAGIQGGGFNVPLQNVLNPIVGGESGKVAGGVNYYSDIPEQSKLSNGAVSNDGQFAIFTSVRRQQQVWVCYNPLGDPGDPSLPINPNFFVAPASASKCMSVGTNGLAVTLTNDFGPDNQPYLGGQRVINTFDSTPGSSPLNLVPSAWPQCIFNNVGGLTGTIAQKLQTVFNAHSSNHCGPMQANNGWLGTLVTQPQSLISHGSYMYTGPIGGTVEQMKVTTDPISGFSQYQFRTYVTGTSLITGLGVADDLGSLIVMGDPTALGLAGQEVMTKLPLCEDF